MTITIPFRPDFAQSLRVIQRAPTCFRNGQDWSLGPPQLQAVAGEILLIPWAEAAVCQEGKKKNGNFFCGSEDVDTRKLSQFYQRFTPQFTRIHVCKNWWKRIHRIKRVPDFQQGSSCSMVTFTTTWLKRKCSRGIWSDQNQQRSLLPC